MNEPYLEHHGILGMKWGIRRYQNADGTLTPAGKRRYRSDESMNTKESKRREIVGNNKDLYMEKHGEMRDQHRIQQKLEDEARSLTPAEKKKITTSVAVIATVSAAAYYVHKHPEKIGKVMSQFKGVKVGELSEKAVTNGKKIVNEMIKSAGEGIKEGVKEAPKKAGKAVVTGVTLNLTKKALDSAVGKEESAKIFQANDNKKIGKFWKVSPDDKDDDDD